MGPMSVRDVRQRWPEAEKALARAGEVGGSGTGAYTVTSCAAAAKALQLHVAPLDQVPSGRYPVRRSMMRYPFSASPPTG